MNGRFQKVYGPGQHTVWTLGGSHEFLVTSTLEWKPLPDDDPLPAELEGTRQILVGPLERVGLWVNGTFRQVLGPGRYRVWLEIGEVREERFDLRADPAPVGSDDTMPAAVDGQYTTRNFAGPALLMRDGRPVGVVGAGRYRVWAGARWELAEVPTKFVEVTADPWAGQAPGSKVVSVGAQERAVVLVGGAFSQVLGPGRHLYWEVIGSVEILRFDLREPPQPVSADDPLPATVAGQFAAVVSADPALLVRGGRPERVLPPGVWRVWGAGPWQIQALPRVPQAVTGDPFAQAIAGARVVDVAPQEVAAAFARGQFVACLGAGRWLHYDAAGELELERYDLRAEPAPIPEGDRLPLDNPMYSRGVSDAGTALVLLRDGKPVRALAPGRWRAWAGSRWGLKEVALSLQALDVAAQDLLSRDQIPVRVKPAVSVRVEEPVRVLAEPDWLNQVYLAAQLALREVVAGRDLDQLIGEREALSAELRDRARAHLPAVGVALEVVSVKDIILPGEVKDLMGKVTLARKEAEALAIKRREETAQTRQLANTARLLESNPVLMRLKEIEALGEIAAKIDRITLVGSGDMVKSVLLSDLTSGRGSEGRGEGGKDA